MRAPLKAIPPTLTLFMAITLAACAKPTPTAPAAPAQTLPTISGLTISGMPASFSNGLSVQLKAILTLSNGTQMETLEVAAAWQSSDKSVASVSNTGLLVVTGFGDADVTATFQNQHASAHVALPKPPPPSARLAVVIDSHGSTSALAGATDITFDLSASTGTGLRYDLAFGDGTSSSAVPPVAKHTYEMVGDFMVRATVTDMLGRSDTATQTVSVVIVGVNWGNWNYPTPSYPDAQFAFTQVHGRDFTGWYSTRGPSQYTSSTMTGTLGSGNDIHFVVTESSIAFDGPVILAKTGWHMLLTIRGGPNNGLTRDFVFYNSY